MKARNLIKISLLCYTMLQALTSGAQTVTKIAKGCESNHSLFLKSDGSLWGMGENYNGELGDGTLNNTTNLPELIVASNVTAIAVGGYTSLFLKSDGSLWGMGENYNGELGDGTLNNTNLPELIVASNVTAIACGSAHSLFLKSDGSLWAMGYNYYGQLGDGSTNNGNYYTNLPELIVASNVTAIACGANHSLFLKSDGSLWGMGFHGDGELGDDTYSYYYSGTNQPEQIVASNVTAIACGGYTSLFLKSDGSLWGMGYNGEGELGDGTYNEILKPEKILSSNVTAIAAGEEHSLFLKSDGSLWAMGANYNDQLGDGTYYNTNRPEQIVASNVTAIAAGYAISLFLKSDGSLWGMGENYYGELGDGTYNEISKPEKIAPLVLLNGGFEFGYTGQDVFLDWVGSGNFTGCFVNGNYVHSGNQGAQLGPVGSLGYLSQTVPTTAGASYLLSFWLDSPDGETPNEFLVSWNGSTLFDQVNLGAIGWTNMQFMVTATGTNTVLQFGFRDDPSFFGLDDISVVNAVPPQPSIVGISLAGKNLLVNGANGLSGRTYYVLMGTNITQSLSQWTPVATNVLGASGNFTITATNAVNLNVPPRFYILQLQ